MLHHAILSRRVLRPTHNHEPLPALFVHVDRLNVRLLTEQQAGKWAYKDGGIELGNGRIALYCVPAGAGVELVRVVRVEFGEEPIPGEMIWPTRAYGGDDVVLAEWLTRL